MQSGHLELRVIIGLSQFLLHVPCKCQKAYMPRPVMRRSQEWARGDTSFQNVELQEWKQLQQRVETDLLQVTPTNPLSIPMTSCNQRLLILSTVRIICVANCGQIYLHVLFGVLELQVYPCFASGGVENFGTGGPEQDPLSLCSTRKTTQGHLTMSVEISNCHTLQCSWILLGGSQGFHQISSSEQNGLKQ